MKVIKIILLMMSLLFLFMSFYLLFFTKAQNLTILEGLFLSLYCYFTKNALSYYKYRMELRQYFEDVENDILFCKE